MSRYLLQFPTKKTIKKWKEAEFNFKADCTAGFTLLDTTEEGRMLKEPGLMEFGLNDAGKKPIESGSFCAYFKMYGTICSALRSRFPMLSVD